MSQMYACDLFEAKFLYNWEKINDKSWWATQPHFTKKYAKEQRKLDREQAHNNDENSAAFQEAPRPHTIETPHGGATATTADDSFAEAMGYAVALEEKANTQAERIIDLKASVDSKTVLIKATNFLASAVTTGGTNKDLKKATNSFCHRLCCNIGIPLHQNKQRR